MTTGFFLDYHGIIHIVYQEKSKTIMEIYNENAVGPIRCRFDAETAEFGEEKILFQQDNAQCASE